MKGHFAFYVETIDEHKSPLHSTGTRLEDMVLDAMEIYEDEKEPVFLRISFGDLDGGVVRKPDPRSQEPADCRRAPGTEGPWFGKLERNTNMEPFEEIRKKYPCNTGIDVVDEEGKTQCVGVVTEVYQYGDLVVMAVWDVEEPLAWAMVYKGDGVVQHYDLDLRLVVRDDA